MSKFSVKEKFTQLSSFIGSVFGGAKAKLQQTVSKKPVIKTGEEILPPTTTEATPPSELRDESLTVTPAITTEGLSQEAVSQSPVSEMVEPAPTPPPVIEEEEKQVIPPTETSTAAETETVVEIIQTEVVVSETPTAAETETVVEITQTEVVVTIEETGETLRESEVSSPNPVTSELLAAETAEKSDMTVEEVKSEGEALPEQIPLDQPVGE
jgi:hypothetical protein